MFSDTLPCQAACPDLGSVREADRRGLRGIVPVARVARLLLPGRGRRRRRAHLAGAARPRQRRARAAPAARAALRSRRRPAQPSAPRPLPRRVRAVRGAALRARRPCGAAAARLRPERDGPADPRGLRRGARRPRRHLRRPRPFADGEPVPLGPFVVTPYRVEHPVEAYGLRVEVQAGRRLEVLAYTGDTDTCDALVPARQGRRPAARGGVVPAGPRRGARGASDRPAGGPPRRGRRLPAPASSPTCPCGPTRDVVLAEARSALPRSGRRWRARATST